MIQKGLLILGAYLIGAIPFGLLIAKTFYKIDIRQHGSKNPGATNVWRTLGTKPGLTTLILDITKGLLPVLLAKNLFPDQELIALSCGLVAIAGHNWSLFLNGRGGKGVATSAGVFLALLPMQAGVAITTFLIFFLTTRHVSVGSMAGAVGLLSACFFLPTSIWMKSVVGIASILILIKHLPNIKRLRRGEEPKAKF